MKIADRDHPFFRPLWRRVAVVIVVGAWLVFEISVAESPMWVIIAGAFLAYAVWTFLLSWPRASEDKS